MPTWICIRPSFRFFSKLWSAKTPTSSSARNGIRSRRLRTRRSAAFTASDTSRSRALLFGLPLRDTQTGLKLFRTSLIRDVIPRVLSKRFAYDVELLAVAHRRGYRIVDAPVRLEYQRTLGRLRFGAVWRTFQDTLAVFYRLNFLRYYDRPVEQLAIPTRSDPRELRHEECQEPSRRQSHRGRGPALSAGTADRKHIVFFGWRDLRDPRAGGAEYYAHDLLATLARAGFRCTLFVSRAKGQPDREEREYYTVIRKGNRVTCRFHAAAWLARNRDDVDCVVDELSTLPFLSRLVARDKTVVLVHQLAREVWWFEAPAPIAAVGFALEPLMVQIYRSAPAITVSKSSAASLREIGLRGPIEIIENPLEPPVEAASAFVRGRIGFVGRLTPSKRVDHIVRAFGMLAARWPKAELWIVGGGEERTLASLRALAKRLGCEDRVRFTGHVPGAERDAILASLDCLVMASAREGWGRVVSEAARYGVPSVGYDVYGLRDAIVDGKTGLLVRDQRPEALAVAIERLLEDESLRGRLGAEAARYLGAFGYDRFESRILRYFTNLPRSEPASARALSA